MSLVEKKPVRFDSNEQLQKLDRGLKIKHRNKFYTEFCFDWPSGLFTGDSPGHNRLFSIKSYVLGIHQNNLGEAIIIINIHKI